MQEIRKRNNIQYLKKWFLVLLTFQLFSFFLGEIHYPIELIVHKYSPTEFCLKFYQTATK